MQVFSHWELYVLMKQIRIIYEWIFASNAYMLYSPLLGASKTFQLELRIQS